MRGATRSGFERGARSKLGSLEPDNLADLLDIDRHAVDLCRDPILLGQFDRRTLVPDQDHHPTSSVLTPPRRT